MMLLLGQNKTERSRRSPDINVGFVDEMKHLTSVGGG